MSSGTISFMQDMMAAPEDMFTVINYNVRTFKPEDYRIKVTGEVDSEKEYTLADLKAMPQVSHKGTKTCVLNPIGGAEIYNAEYTGVDLMAFLKNAGMKEDANQINFISYDGWNWAHGFNRLTKGLLCLTMNGAEMAPARGNPVTLALPGEPGAEWVKYVQTIEVKKVSEDQLQGPLNTLFTVPYTCNPVNAGFLKPTTDGAEVSSPVHLEGWAFCWPMALPTKLLFSADYGKNWHEYAIPKNMDPAQWVYWKVDWTPPGPGRYLLKVKAQKGEEIQQKEDNLVLVVK
jgi:DMSO/TMAO reductase YedYZ molybdopterin-dependent catalytic subunit